MLPVAPNVQSSLLDGFWRFELFIPQIQDSHWVYEEQISFYFDCSDMNLRFPGTQRFLASRLPNLQPLWPARCWQGFLKGCADNLINISSRFTSLLMDRFLQRLMDELFVGIAPIAWSKKEVLIYARGQVMLLPLIWQHILYIVYYRCHGAIDGTPLRWQGENFHPYHFNCTGCNVELTASAREVGSKF